jgi:hypothetical protein
MSKDYNPHNWYWIVGADETKFYSSAAGDYVQSSSPAYVAWSADGTTPTRIGSEADLGEVLAPYSLRPAAANVLDGYQDTQSRKLTLEVVAKVLFNLANEIRALKGQQPLTANQFRNYVKGLM